MVRAVVQVQAHLRPERSMPLAGLRSAARAVALAKSAKVAAAARVSTAPVAEVAAAQVVAAESAARQALVAAEVSRSFFSNRTQRSHRRSSSPRMPATEPKVARARKPKAAATLDPFSRPH